MATLPIQKAPHTFNGLNIRASSRPAGNVNSRRRDPPRMFSSVSANPTHKSPSGPQTAKLTSPHATSRTRTASARVGSSRMKKA